MQLFKTQNSNDRRRLPAATARLSVGALPRQGRPYRQTEPTQIGQIIDFSLRVNYLTNLNNHIGILITHFHANLLAETTLLISANSVSYFNWSCT